LQFGVQDRRQPRAGERDALFGDSLGVVAVIGRSLKKQNIDF